MVPKCQVCSIYGFRCLYVPQWCSRSGPMGVPSNEVILVGVIEKRTPLALHIVILIESECTVPHALGPVAVVCYQAAIDDVHSRLHQLYTSCG